MMNDCKCCKNDSRLQPCPECGKSGDAVDLINRPPHYANLKPEPIDVIESWGLGYHLGTVLKYIARAGKKEGAPIIQDLEKARWYLSREIERLKKVSPSNPASVIGFEIHGSGSLPGERVALYGGSGGDSLREGGKGGNY